MSINLSDIVTFVPNTVSKLYRNCINWSIYSQQTPGPGQVVAGTAEVWLPGRVVEVPVERGPKVLRPRRRAHPDGAKPG